MSGDTGGEPEAAPERDAGVRAPGPSAWVWVVLAAAGFAVVLFLTSLSQGACYDSSDPAKSYCTSGPVVTEAGVWILWSLWGLFAAACLLLVVRRIRRRAR